MDTTEKIAYNCRKATLLIEKKQFELLSTGEQLELRMHLAGCSVCRLYEQQSITINKLLKQFSIRRTGITLDAKTKEALQDQINKKLG